MEVNNTYHDVEEGSDGGQENAAFGPERRLLRRIASDPSVTTTTAQMRARCQMRAMEDSMMYKAIIAYHRQMPKSLTLHWLTNLRSMLEGMSNGSNCVPIGSAFSGSEVWVHGLRGLYNYWHRCYDVPKLDIKHCFVAEQKSAKREFLTTQFDLPVAIEDAAELCQPRSWNLTTGAPVIVEWPQNFGGGFSCKGKSKQNNQRAGNRSCIADGTTCTGLTCEYCRKVIVKMRPLLAVLENVPEISLPYEQDSGITASDSEYIVSVFEKDG